MPLVPPALLETLLAEIDAGGGGDPRGGRPLQPLCAAYAPEALRELEAAPYDEPLKRTLLRLPRRSSSRRRGRAHAQRQPPGRPRAGRAAARPPRRPRRGRDRAADDWIAWARAEDHDTSLALRAPAARGLLPEPGLLTLDIGCGEGRMARELQEAGHQVVGRRASPRLRRGPRGRAADAGPHRRRRGGRSTTPAPTSR
jgi:hypothetical protein